jgi:succinyl-diaminopimelate desuccinylase
VTVLHTPNTTCNRVPARAEAVLDIRFPAPHTLPQMRGELEELLGEGIEVETSLCAEPLHVTPDPLFLEVCREVTGSEPARARDDGASDSRFIGDLGIPVIMSRPLVGELHGEREWIDIASMTTFYRICERYLHRKLVRPPEVPAP